MQRRRNYHKSPLYYPDDKDIRDFLRSTPVGERKLRVFLMLRGIMPPKMASQEELIERISRLTLGWNDLTALVDLVDLGEKQEKIAFADINFSGKLEEARDALDKVKELRQQPQKESYKISAINGKIVASIDYIETDTSKTPMLQGRPATLKLEIEEHKGNLRITHTSNETSKEVVKEFLEQLKTMRKDDGDEIKASSISLADILDTRLRVEFFKKLAHNIEGFEYERATSVKVARMPLLKAIGESGIEDPADEESHEDATEETKEVVLRNAILQGFNVEKSDHYQKLLEAGFFVSNLTWDSIEIGSKDRVSFTAGFKKNETAEVFEFKVNHRVIFDNGEYKVRDKLPTPALEGLKRKICHSADFALIAIRRIATENDAGPAPQDTQ